jgi:host factor-I protein
MTTKGQFNIQDQYLNQLRKERLKVVFKLSSGENVSGNIKSFDMFCVLIESEGGDDVLLYKHAVASIESENKKFRLQQQQKNEGQKRDNII